MEYAISTQYIYIYAVAIRTGYIFQAFSTAIASAVCIPYLGSPAALYINYISAGKINIFMNFLSAARIVVSPVAVEDGAGAETDGWRGGGAAAAGIHDRRQAAQTAMQQRQQRCGNAHWRQGAPRKKATALARGSPASVLREKLRNGASCELRTENEMLLLKLAKFYVCAGSFYIEIAALDDLLLKIRVEAPSSRSPSGSRPPKKSVAYFYAPRFICCFGPLFILSYYFLYVFQCDIRTFAPMCRMLL